MQNNFTCLIINGKQQQERKLETEVTRHQVQFCKAQQPDTSSSPRHTCPSIEHRHAKRGQIAAKTRRKDKRKEERGNTRHHCSTKLQRKSPGCSENV